ncbi:hypothetical protein AAEO56_08185 [Flavobacterium sp. DGU11]|uniref:WG repeat-containing protein n=1 Tax=Flavobacterium arundinis TaxID=3139143 RepID=A0ABU9HVN7_9FLAO
MKKYIALVITLHSLIASAQLQKDSKPDYIIDRFFAVKEGGLYYEVKSEGGTLKYGRAADSPESLARLDNLPEEAIVPIASLRRVAADKMLEELQHVQMNYPHVEGAAQNHVVNFLTNSLAVVSSFSTSYDGQVNTAFWRLEHETIAGYTILNVYKDGNLSGRIYPFKQGFKLRMFYGYGENPTVGKITDEEGLRKRVRLNFPPTEIFTENNAYGLRLQETKKVIVSAVYDSIGNSGSSMVAAYSGKKVKLLYRNGDLAVDGLRAQYGHSDRYTGVLKDNEVFYIDNEGNRLDKLPQYMEGRCGTVPHYTDSIVKQGGYYKHYHVFRYGETRRTETVLAKVSDFKEVRLINGSTNSQSLITAYYSPHNTNRKGYIVTLNSGAKSIIEINKDGTYKLSLEPDNYTFLTKEYVIEIPLRFKSNGLYGFWPQNNSARYKELSDFDKGFARFTLPDGTMGWLAFDGGEYVDE